MTTFFRRKMLLRNPFNEVFWSQCTIGTPIISFLLYRTLKRPEKTNVVTVTLPRNNIFRRLKVNQMQSLGHLLIIKSQN